MKLFVIFSLMLVAATAWGQAEEIVLPTPTGSLAGTLLLPEGDEPWPVVLILAGSGPTDRDGNSAMFPGKNNSLRQLAESLRERGIASLRVDKRGVGGSRTAAIPEVELTFDQFIDDAVRWCRLLADDRRFSSVSVAGHSQGAQVGAAAAWRVDADGYASLCGPGRPILELLREQMAGQLTVRSRVKFDEALDELAAGRTVAEVPAGLDMILRPAIQPFLISWQRRDPVMDVKRLSPPILILQGTTDLQVSVEDARRLAEARPEARLVIVEGMNHLFREIPRENTLAQQMSLVDSTQVFMTEAVDAVAELVFTADAGAAARRAARARARSAGLRGVRLMKTQDEDRELSAQEGLTTAERIGRWARRFAAENEMTYLFGPSDGGYVAEGALISDRRQDCVSLLYRVGELARARDHVDAVDWALRTRFAGAVLDSVVGQDGRVDYDHPAHLDYSLDMIRTGLWGRDVTVDLTGAEVDSVGTARYPAGSFSFVPTAALDTTDLAEGDIVWFVLNPRHAGAAKLRTEHGLVIGHIGIVIVEDRVPTLVHAARSDLEGWYEGGRVVGVPLTTYLARIDRFAGVMVTRFGPTAPPSR